MSSGLDERKSPTLLRRSAGVMTLVIRVTGQLAADRASGTPELATDLTRPVALAMKVGDDTAVLGGKLVVRQGGVPVGVDVLFNLNLPATHRFAFFCCRGVALRT